MVSVISANQGLSKEISENIPFAGTWFYPKSGVEQIIFPDFQVEGSSDPNEIYWPSAQLANLYTAWSPQQIAGAPYRATVTPENGIEKRFDAVKNGSSGGINYIDIYGQIGGFTDVLENIYQGMNWSPSAETQELINEGMTTANKLYKELAGDVASAYANNSAFKPSGQGFFGTAQNPTLTSGAVQQSLQQMAVVIASNPETIINQSTDVWDQYQTAKGKGQAAVTNFMNQLATDLIAGVFDWGHTFNQSFGPESAFGFEYTLPWDDNLYTQYKSIVGDPRIVAWQEAVEVAQSNNHRLGKSVNYLADLKTRNNTISKEKPEGAFTTTPVLMFDKVQDGPSGAPAYAPRWSTSPNSAKGDTSIEFNIRTNTVESQTTNFFSGVQWSSEVGATANGWFFSAKADAISGLPTTKNAWSQLDSTAMDIIGNFQWTDLQSKVVTPSSLWWFPTAVSQALSQVHTINDPGYSGGFGFHSPKTANQFVTSEIYRISGIAYGVPSSVVTGETSNSSKYTSSSFERSYANASASGGVGWGPFSFGASSTYSTSDQKSSDALKFSSSGTSFTVTNNPLDGFSPQPGVGSASSLVGVTVSPIGNASAQPIAGDSSSSRGKGKGGKSLFTFTAVDDARKRHYHDLGGGHDTHYGGSRKSIIDGGKGRDTLAGLNGSDVLSGGKGDDVIYPGKGKRNIIYLGRGDDFVVFEQDDLGFTVVKDFAEGDRLSFSGYVSSDLKFEGKILIADDVKIARFKGKGVAALLENAIEDAHYSLPSDFASIADLA